MLVLMCGVGKTLISLWITQKLNSNTILIGVPSRELLYQWEKVITSLFDIVPLIVDGKINVDTIVKFLEINQKSIVITTYSSAHKVYAATKELNFNFDMKILDEVHHLTSSNMKLKDNEKTYIQMLHIPSVKQLGLTATLKLLENNENSRNDEIVVSNDNIEHFGEILDRKGLLWAINENIICDYVIQTIITREEQLENQLSRLNITEENDKRLFLSAFASLKSICDGHSHHQFIYSNTIEHSNKIIKYIEMLLENNYFDIPELYYSSYTGDEITAKTQKEIISNFEKANFGIITCVYALSEGKDLPYLDAVVFAENMTSPIRIVQSALRAIRKNINEPYKRAKIILPILNRDDWLENNEKPDLKKVKEVIYQMGLEDETITHKIKVFRIDIEKQKPKPKEKEERIIDEFDDEIEEFTQKLLLKTVRRTAQWTSYEKARKIIADKNIKSKDSYYELCERDHRLPKDPEDVFSQFTNWIEYLSIERIYYDLETCKKKVCEYLSANPDLKLHRLNLSFVMLKLCNIDKLFPPNGLWVEYYKVMGFARSNYDNK